MTLKLALDFQRPPNPSLPRDFNALVFLDGFSRQPSGQRDLKSFVLFLNLIKERRIFNGRAKHYVIPTINELSAAEIKDLALHADLTREGLLALQETNGQVQHPNFQFMVECRLLARSRQGENLPLGPAAALAERCANGFGARLELKEHQAALLLLAEELAAGHSEANPLPPPLQSQISAAMLLVKSRALAEPEPEIETAVRAVGILLKLQFLAPDTLQTSLKEAHHALLTVEEPTQQAELLNRLKSSPNQEAYEETASFFELLSFARRFTDQHAPTAGLWPLALFLNEVGEAGVHGLKRYVLGKLLCDLSKTKKKTLAHTKVLTAAGLNLLRIEYMYLKSWGPQLTAAIRLLAKGEAAVRAAAGNEAWNKLTRFCTTQFQAGMRTKSHHFLVVLSRFLLTGAPEAKEALAPCLIELGVEAQKSTLPEKACQATAILIALDFQAEENLKKLIAYIDGSRKLEAKVVLPLAESDPKAFKKYLLLKLWGTTDEEAASAAEKALTDLIDDYTGTGSARRHFAASSADPALSAASPEEIERTMLLKRPDSILRHRGAKEFISRFRLLSAEEKKQSAAALAEALQKFPKECKNLPQAGGISNFHNLLAWVGDNLAPEETSPEKYVYFAAVASLVPKKLLRQRAEIQTLAQEERERVAQELEAAREHIAALRRLVATSPFDLEATAALLAKGVSPPSTLLEEERKLLDHLTAEANGRVRNNREVLDRIATLEALLAAETLDTAAAEKLLKDKFKPKKSADNQELLAAAETMLKERLDANAQTRERIAQIRQLLSADIADRHMVAERILLEECSLQKKADLALQLALAEKEKEVEARIAANEAVQKRLDELNALLAEPSLDMELAQIAQSEECPAREKADAGLREKLGQTESTLKSRAEANLLAAQSLEAIRLFLAPAVANLERQALRKMTEEELEIPSAADEPLKAKLTEERKNLTAILKQAEGADNEVREKLRILKTAANLADADRPQSFDPEQAAQRLAKVADYQPAAASHTSLCAELGRTLARVQTEVAAAQEKRRAAHQEIETLLAAMRTQQNQENGELNLAAAEALVTTAETLGSNLMAAKALRDQLRAPAGMLKSKISAVRSQRERAGRRAAAIPATRAESATAGEAPKLAPAKINNLEQALAKLQKDPADEYVWERLLILFSGSFPAAAKKGKESSSPKKTFFRRLTLAAPALTTTQAQRIKDRWGAAAAEELANTYLSEGDNEDNLEVCLQLYTSAGALGSPLAAHRLRKLELTREDLVRLQSLASSRNWQGLKLELDRLEAELDRGTFILLKTKLGLPVTRAIADCHDFELPPPGATQRLLRDLIFGFEDRRVDASLTQKMLKGEIQSNRSPSFAAAAALGLPFDSHRILIAGWVLVKWNAIWGPEHPDFAAAAKINPALNDTGVLAQTFESLAEHDEQSRLAIALGERLLREHAQVFQKDPAFLYRMGVQYLQTQQFTKAGESFEATLELDPSNPKTLKAALLCYILARQYKKVITLGKRVTSPAGGQKSPAEPKILSDALSFVAQAHRHLGNLAEAYSLHQRALAVSSQNRNAVRNLIEINLEKHEKAKNPALLKEALELAQRYVELAPDEPSSHETLGRCYFQLEEHEKAKKALQQAIRLLTPSSVLGTPVSNLYYNLAAAYNALGQHRAAADCTEKALSSSYSPTGLWRFLSSLMEAKEYSRAIPYFPQAEALFPEKGFSYRLQHAFCLMQQGSYAQARRILEELHQEQPEDAEVTINLGVTCFNQDDYAAALAHFEKIPQTSDLYLDAQASMVEILALLGKTQEAGPRGRALLAQIPAEKKAKRALALFALMQVALSEGKMEEARHWLAEGQALDSSAQGLMAEAACLKDQPEQQLELFCRAIAAGPWLYPSWKELFSLLRDHPEFAPRLASWMEDQREKTDLSLFYRAAKETGVLDLALREILPLGKKENLLKLQRDLCLCGEMADLPGIFSGLSPEMARDPEVQKTALRNHYFLDDYDGILARAEAVARAQEEGSRSQLEAKLIWAKALETREKPEEAERIYQEVLNQQGVASDQELSARFGLFRIMLSRDKAGIALDRALRFLKPSIRKSAGTTELFAYLGQLMEAAPKEQAAEIGLLIEEHLGAFAFALQMIPEKLKEDKPDLDELFEIHLKMGGGPLLSALSTLLPLARKAGAAPNLQEITAQLTKEFKEKS